MISRIEQTLRDSISGMQGVAGAIEPGMLREVGVATAAATASTNSGLLAVRPQSTSVDYSFKSSESMSDLTDLNFVGLDTQKVGNDCVVLLLNTLY